MPRPSCRLVVTACLLLGAAPASAEHGMDFLLVHTPGVPRAGTGHLFVHQNYLSRQRSLFQTEPGILFGLTDRIAIATAGRMEKPQSRSARYTATTPALHIRFTGAQQPLGIGLSAAYQVAHQDERRDRLDGALSVSRESARLLAAVNLLYRKESGLSREWGYAGGARVNIGARHGLGVEINGSLHSGGTAEALLGYYGRPSPSFTVNAGIGTGVDSGPDWTARTSFVWRFR